MRSETMSMQREFDFEYQMIINIMKIIIITEGQVMRNKTMSMQGKKTFKAYSSS